MISQNLEKNLEILEAEEIDENIVKAFKENNANLTLSDNKSSM